MCLFFAILQGKVDCLAIGSHDFAIHDLPIARSIGKMIATARTMNNVELCVYTIFHYIVNVHITYDVMSYRIISYYIIRYDSVNLNKDWFLQGTAFQLSAPRAWHTNYNKPGQCSTLFAKIFDKHKGVEHHPLGHYIYLYIWSYPHESFVLNSIYLADVLGHVPASFCLSCYLEWWCTTSTRSLRVWLNNQANDTSN